MFTNTSNRRVLHLEASTLMVRPCGTMKDVILEALCG